MRPPSTARRRDRRPALKAGLTLLLPLVVLSGCGQAPPTQGPLVCTPVDAGERGLKSSLTRQSLPPDDEPICSLWRVCD